MNQINCIGIDTTKVLLTRRIRVIKSNQTVQIKCEFMNTLLLKFE